MNISSVGASSIQALNLISRLSSSSNGAGGSDLLSSLGSETDSLSISSQGQWASRSQGSNPFKTDFDNLGSLIASGDIEGAKKAYAAMQDKMQAHQQSGNDPMASDFAAIGSALAAGDVSAAQTAWDTMQEKLRSMGAPPPKGNEIASGSASTRSSSKMSELDALLVSMSWQSSQFTNTTSGS